MDHFTITKFEIQDAGNNNIVILITGNRLYKRFLANAYPGHYLSRTFDDRHGRFDWGTYMYTVDESTRQSVESLLRLCSQCVNIDDDLSSAFALDYHTEMNPYGGYQRSTIGELVYRAKPYSRPVTQQNHDAAKHLAQKMIAFIRENPVYQRCGLILATPSSNPDKPFNLPIELVKHIANAFPHIQIANTWLRKTRATKPMKDCTTISDKIENVRNAFKATPKAAFAGKKVIVIDDIYQSGYTINEVGRTLMNAGANSVFGLVATKTGRDL